MNRKMVIKGTGAFIAIVPGDSGYETLCLGKLQNLKIDLNTDTENVFGGDGIYPFENFVREKTCEITATDAQFDLETIRLMTGADPIAKDQESYIWEIGKRYEVTASGTKEQSIITIDGTVSAVGDLGGKVAVALNNTYHSITVEIGDTAIEVAAAIADAIDILSGYSATAYGPTVVIEAVSVGNQVDTIVDFDYYADYEVTGLTANVDKVDGSVAGAAGFTLDGTVFSGTVIGSLANRITVRDADNNLLTRTVGDPGANEFKLSGSEVQVHTDRIGQNLSVNYMKSETTDILTLGTDDAPFVTRVIHNGYFEQKKINGSSVQMGVQTEFFAARAKGTYSIDVARATAATSAITLEVLDPELSNAAGLGSVKMYQLS